MRATPAGVLFADAWHHNLKEAPGRYAPLTSDQQVRGEGGIPSARARETLSKSWEMLYTLAGLYGSVPYVPM
jgi:hypothetical protein